MKRYPLIGVPAVITPPVATMGALTGVALDLTGLTDTIDIAEGMVLQNAGATARLSGSIVVFFLNTHISAALTVTPAVTATRTEAGGEVVNAVPKEITIPAGHMAMVGPFSRANEDEEQKVGFTFTGTEGECYAVSIR